MLKEEAAQFTTADMLKNEVERLPTNAVGIVVNMDPPAALLLAAAQVTADVLEVQSLKTRWITRKLEEPTINEDAFNDMLGNVYDSKITATAPPYTKAPFEAPPVNETTERLDKCTL